MKIESGCKGPSRLNILCLSFNIFSIESDIIFNITAGYFGTFKVLPFQVIFGSRDRDDCRRLRGVVISIITIQFLSASLLV